MALVALLLLVAPAGRGVRQLRARQVITGEVVLALAGGLSLADLLVCLWFLVSAGLGHSARLQTLVLAKCLISFLGVAVLPTTMLLLLRRHQHSRPELYRTAESAPLLWSFAGGPTAIIAQIAAAAAILALPLPLVGGWPPLLLAVRVGSPTLAGWLVDLGADVNPIGQHGWGPLIAAVEEGNPDMVRLLLDRGADVNCGGCDPSPLVTAVMRGRPDVVRLLLDRGADPDRSSVFGPPLVLAASHGRPDVVRMLLERGADVRVTDAAGDTCLMVALGFPQVLATLIAGGADPDALSGEHNVYVPGERVTALMVASGWGVEPATRVLLEGGADPATRSSKGRTALDFAQQGGRHEVVELLGRYARQSVE